MRIIPILVGMVVLAASFPTFAQLTSGSAYNLNAPSSSSGSYIVTWSNENNAYYTLQEKKDSGNWTSVLSSTTVTYKSFNKDVSGAYSYRIEHRSPCYRYCYNGPYYYYYSEIKTTNVTVQNGSVPNAPSNVQGPSSDNDGAFPITWNAPTGEVDTYTVQQRVGSGSWYTVGSTDKTIMWMTNRSNGSYTYRVRACNNNGCGSYSSYFYGSVNVSLNSSAPVNVTYTYDELGRLVSVVDSKSGTSTFEYDDAGNRVEVTTNNDRGNSN